MPVSIENGETTQEKKLLLFFKYEYYINMIEKIITINYIEINYSYMYKIFQKPNETWETLFNRFPLFDLDNYIRTVWISFWPLCLGGESCNWK